MAKKTAKATTKQPAMSASDREQFELGVKARKEDAKNGTEPTRSRAEPAAWWSGYDHQRSLEKK